MQKIGKRVILTTPNQLQKTPTPVLFPNLYTRHPAFALALFPLFCMFWVAGDQLAWLHTYLPV